MDICSKNSYFNIYQIEGESMQQISHKRVNIEYLSDEFLDTLKSVFAENLTEESLVFTLSTYANIICGLNINEIRSRLPFIERNKVRFPCREYIRKNIVQMVKKIEKSYNVTYNHKYVSPLLKEENIDLSISLPIKVKDVLNNEDIEEDKDITEEDKDVVEEDKEEIEIECSEGRGTF